MTLRKLFASTVLAIALSMGVSIDALATTSTINITPTSYVSVAGPGTVAATVTATRDIQYIFSATQPATIVLGHKLAAGQSIPLASMGSGIYMWVISEVGSGVAVVTLGTDAIISNGTASGGGGGGDASAENQTSVQANAGSDASKAISIQGITSGKAISVSGTFWQSIQPVSGTITVNAGTNLNTSALALDTSVNGVIVSQASTTSGQKGPIIQGAVTTSAPSYTTAQTSPFSLDTSGNLRVVTSGGLAQGSTTSGQNGSLLQAATTTSAPTYSNGTTNPISTDTSGNIRINCVTGCGGGTGGTAQTDQAAFTAGTTSFTPIGGVFSNGLSAITTGQNSTARITSDRAILVSQIPPTAASGIVTNVDSTAYEASHVISNAPATLLGCFGYNSKTSAQFMQIFNSTTVPADTTAPAVAPINVAASSSWSIDFGAYGRPFSTGIAISNSSTGATKTIGSADSWFSCRIK